MISISYRYDPPPRFYALGVFGWYVLLCLGFGFFHNCYLGAPMNSPRPRRILGLIPCNLGVKKISTGASWPPKPFQNEANVGSQKYIFERKHNFLRIAIDCGGKKLIKHRFLDETIYCWKSKSLFRFQKTVFQKTVQSTRPD